MMFGNEKARQQTLKTLEGNSNVFVLSGPSNIGKMSFIDEEIKTKVYDDDFLLVDHSIAGSREIRSFISSPPSFSQFKIAVIDSAHNLSEPAQDAYLKICEEPPPYLKLYFVTEDFEMLSSALRSRIINIIRWSRLSDEEMKNFISHEYAEEEGWEELFDLSDNRPGFYVILRNNSSLVSFHDICYETYLDKLDFFESPVPKIFSNLKDPDIRNCFINICRIVARKLLADGVDKLKISHLYEFASVLKRHSSANPSIFWSRLHIIEP